MQVRLRAEKKMRMRKKVSRTRKEMQYHQDTTGLECGQDECATLVRIGTTGVGMRTGVGAKMRKQDALPPSQSSISVA